MIPPAIDEIEIQLFLEALRLRHGYDFSDYARPSLQRRLATLTASLGRKHLVELLPRLLREEDFVSQIIALLTVPVTHLFRHPATFLALRDKALTWLSSFPRLTIWMAGCASGEEVYSLAILLHEAGLLPHTTLFATDINDQALAKAEEGVYPLEKVKQSSNNYLAAGGRHALLDYFHVAYDFAKVDETIKRPIVFAHHNLVSDGIFAESHLIYCSNVLIYFNKALQSRVLGLFRDSLVRGGILCLGHRESLQFSVVEHEFKELDGPNRLYQSRMVY